jgi:hypothetical protein
MSATGENIAHDSSVEGAHRGLMRSPRHRANILSRECDRVGIGIVSHGRMLLVTQNFRRAIKSVDPDAAAREILSSLNAAGRRKGLPDLTVRRDLTAIAREVAERSDRDQWLLSRLPGELLSSRGVPYRQFFSYVILDRSVQPAGAIREVSRHPLDSVGIGVVVNRSQEKGLGMLWMVVLLALSSRAARLHGRGLLGKPECRMRTDPLTGLTRNDPSCLTTRRARSR